MGNATLGPTKDPMKNAAEMLIVNPEYALSQGLVKNSLIIFIPIINFEDIESK